MTSFCYVYFNDTKNLLYEYDQEFSDFNVMQ